MVAVLHDAGAADDLQVGHLGQVGQDFVLHAIGEEAVGLVVAQVLEGQHRNGFFRDDRRCTVVGGNRRDSLPGWPRHPPNESHPCQDDSQRRPHHENFARPPPAGGWLVRSGRTAVFQRGHQFPRGGGPLRRVFRQHRAQEGNDGGRDLPGRELLHRQSLARGVETQLVEGSPGEGHPPGQRVPQRDAQRINVRARVHRHTLELLRAGEGRRAHETAVGQVDLARRAHGFGQAEVDHLHLQPGRSEFPSLSMRLLGLRSRWISPRFAAATSAAATCAGDLQRGGGVERAVAAHAGFERLALDQFHRVITLAGRVGSPEVENPGDVRMPQGRRRARLAQEALTQGRAQIAATGRRRAELDDLQGHRPVQGPVHGAIGDAHGPAPQFPERAIIPARDLEIAVHRGVGASDRRHGGFLCGIDDGFLHQAAAQQAGQTATVRTRRRVTLCAHRTCF